MNNFKVNTYKHAEGISVDIEWNGNDLSNVDKTTKHHIIFELDSSYSMSENLNTMSKKHRISPVMQQPTKKKVSFVVEGSDDDNDNEYSHEFAAYEKGFGAIKSMPKTPELQRSIAITSPPPAPIKLPVTKQFERVLNDNPLSPPPLLDPLSLRQISCQPITGGSSQTSRRLDFNHVKNSKYEILCKNGHRWSN